MPDITSTTKFRGDAAQLLATYKSIGAAAGELQRQINQVNTARLRSAGGPGAGLQPIAGFADRTTGRTVRNLVTELDALNKTFVTTGQTAIRFIDSQGNVKEVLTGTIKTIGGDYNKLVPAVERFSTVQARANQVVERSRTAATNATTALRNLTRARQQDMRAAIESIGRQEAAGIIDPGTARYLRRKERSQYQSFLAQPTQINASTTALEANARATRVAATAQNLLAKASTGVNAALTAIPPVPASIQQLGKQSPQLLRRLQKSGLGTSAGQLYDQGAFAQIEKDLISGTTRITGHFNDLKTGIKQNFTAELDKAGNVVTRFGGQLSNLGNFLNQTVRNLQKVVQWGVATSVVFGGIAVAARELSTLTSLDKNLKNLGITANLTNEQTHALFGDLAEIASRTATPLVELTKSADDIALSVRGAGKSAQEYKTDILNLVEAVGIYTNLTGEDTVKATDLLVSAMKQLGIQTEDVTSLLSKITAVAGGQSNAIADITQGLAVMAEAARQAGLSVDETIAAVQILSQVTAKSPSEIATAFKNLVGSLDSRAGAKALAKFNIELRDGSGELRNILDIYKKISDKIRQGVIPAAEVKGLVKAIAGGPRRAPDAAALLSNIDQIAQAEQRSIRASNEALIVNAKVLDTVQAKITKLQVEFDKFAFERFGTGFKGFIGSLADGLTSLLKIINSIPSGFITIALQAGLFLAGARLGIGVLRTFVNIIREMGVALVETAAEFRLAAVASKQFTTSTLVGPNGQPIQTPIKGASRFSSIKAGLGSAGVGALVGGGISAASGGDLKSVLSGVLSGAGLALLTNPATLAVPWLKVAGVIALAGGALLSFIGNSEDAAKANENAAQKADKLLNAYTRYKDAADTVNDLTKAQADLRAGIDVINNKHEKTAEDLAALQDNQKQYVDNVIAMTQANLQLSDSLREIGSIDEVFATAVREARAGRIPAEKLAELIKEQQLKILQQTNPNAVLPNQVGLLPPPQTGNILPYSGGTTAAIPEKTLGRGIRSGTVQPAYQLDLKELEDKPELVKDLFDKFGQLNSTVPLTSENLALVSQALATLRTNGDSAAPELERVFNIFKSGVSAVDGAQQALQSYADRIKAISYFDPQKAAELQKLLDIASETSKLSLAAGDQATSSKALQQIYDFLNGKEIDKNSVRDVLELNINAMGILGDKTLTTAEKNLILQQRAEAAGLAFDYLGQKARDALGIIDEATTEAIVKMDDLTQSLLENAANNSAGLQAQIQGGAFKGDAAGLKGAKTELDYWNSIIEILPKVNAAYGEITNIAGADDAIQDLAGSLININGLQDAQSLTTQELISRLFALSETYGLTGAQVDILGQKIIDLIATVKKISDIKAQFKIGADIDLSAAIAKLQALRRAMIAGAQRGGGGLGSGAAADTSSIDAAIATLISAQNTGSSITTLLKSGGGTATYKPKSSGGGSKSSGAGGGGGLDISTLDIPEEILKASNAAELIKKAVANAKKLQSQIPGAGKEAKNDIVELLNGTKKVLEVRGVKEDLLRRALEELAGVEKKRLEQETKADTIRRIRIGGGSFAAIANVPVNSQTGVSVGPNGGTINVALNVNGQILTPAQLQQFADMVAAALKRQIAG